VPSIQRYPEPTVGALIFDPAGRLLLVRSHKWGDRYVVPGGHLELGETLEAALRREVAEETGMAISDITFICTQEFIYDPAFWKSRHFIFFDYACQSDSTDVRLNDEAQAYVWVTVDEALHLPIEPYTENAIRTYMAQQANQRRGVPVQRSAVEVIAAEPSDQQVLANLLQLYLYDLSEFDAAQPGLDGRYGYSYLESYWTEPGRHPFLVRVKGQTAGFVLVCTVSAGADPLHSVAEFFVLRSYRRRGVGRAVAQRIFERFPGRWQVKQHAANLPAQAFWRRVIGQYTQGRFKEGWQAEEAPIGPILRFATDSAPRQAF
jgi:nucleoside triphosphatase